MVEGTKDMGTHERRRARGRCADAVALRGFSRLRPPPISRYRLSLRNLLNHEVISKSACACLAVCKRMLAVCKRSLLARLFPCRLGNVLPHGTVAHEADRHAVACESRALCAVPPRVHLHVCGIHFHILGHRPKNETAAHLLGAATLLFQQI